jgi:hypothetical protein
METGEAKGNTGCILVSEKVLTYGTFAASRDLSIYPNKFKKIQGIIP